MNRAERRALEPMIERFGEDLRLRRGRIRYDPIGDVFTLVVYRPNDPVTVRDESMGAFIDFDEEQRRVSALTIVNFRKSFVPRMPNAPQFTWKTRLAFRTMLLLDRLVSWAGVDIDRYWNGIMQGREVGEILAEYREELKTNPERLTGAPQALSLRPV